MKSKHNGLEKIAFPIKLMVICPKKDCPASGDYSKCYNEDHLECKSYFSEFKKYREKNEG